MNQKEKHVKLPEHLRFEKYCQAKDLFRNPDRPSCINLILTNSSRSFQDTCTLETRHSDFHKLVFTVLKIYFSKQKPNIQTFRDYRRFQNDLFRSEFFKHFY